MSSAQDYSDDDVFESLAKREWERDERPPSSGADLEAFEADDPRLWYPNASRELKMPTLGSYANGWPQGAVVHFTAGRCDRGDADAEATIKFGASQEHCYFCISKTGKIYQTAPLSRWGSHAGKSTWQGLGTGLSSKLVGIEICNAGSVKPGAKGFEPWWNKPSDPKNTYYPEAEVRRVAAGANIRSAATFHRYTQEQERSLVELLVWLHRQNPAVFKLEYVLGHDEIAPGRKDDPGGSLSATMPALRAHLRQVVSKPADPPPPPPPAATPPAPAAPTGAVIAPDGSVMQDPAPVGATVVATATVAAAAAAAAAAPAQQVTVVAAEVKTGREPPPKLGPRFVELLRTYRALSIEFAHLKDITFAQWAHETGYGTSELAVRFNNYAGMKWRPDMKAHATQVYYKPAHDPMDTAYCGFSTLADFIRGYWFRLDIRSLPYATKDGGWRARSGAASEFIEFIGPIWAPEGGDNSPLNNGYVRKVKEVRARLERSGLLPSSEPQTPSATVTAALNESTAASSLGAAAQHLQRFQEATRGPSLDRPGMIDALQRLTAALEQPEAGLSADQYRSIIGTLLATNALAHTDAQDNPLFLLIEEIKTAAKPVPPKIADLNQAAGDLYSELGGLPRPLGPGKVDELVKALRNARAFDWLAKICDRLIATGQATNLVHRFYAQALVDSGHIKAGMNVLEELKRQPLPKTDLDEVMGQIGRANKQIYVDHIRTSADAAAAGQRYAPYLREAVRHYSEVFDANRAGDTSWPGINMVALAQRARADGIRLEPAIDPETIARRIIADLEAKDAAGKIEEWDVATLGEAHLALGDFDRAATYYQRYASDKGQNYFKLGSTVRQLEEVWRAGNGGEGIRKCVFALKAALVEQPVAEFGLTAAERRTIRNPQFETSYRDGEFLKYRKLRDIVRAGECIAWIKNGPYAEQGLGTGFLIVGSQLAPVLGSDLYLLTNTHVVCDARIDIRWRDKGSLTPDEAYVQFEAADENADGGGVPRSYRLVRDAVWLSPSSEYDACLLRLTEQPDRVSPARLAASTDAVSFGNEDDDRDGTPVAVLGHAGGRELQIGVRGTLLNHQGNVVDRGPRTREEHPPVYLHYDSPTLGGNSGSPVYDMRTWQVIGLHHAGYDEYEGRARLRGRGGRHNANEGIDIRSIGDAIQRDLSGGGSFWSRFGRRSR